MMVRLIKRCLGMMAVGASLAAQAEMPFPALNNGGAAIHETATQIGLYNAKTGILFDKKQFLMQGLWLAGGKNLVKTSSIWEINLAVGDDRKKEIKLQPSDTGTITFSSSAANGNAELKVVFSNVKKEQYVCDVTVKLLLERDSSLIKWHIAAKITQGTASIWNVMFPIVAAGCMTNDPLDTQLMYPYRRGMVSPLKNDGKMIMPYPGAAVKFQFMSVYNKQTGDGVYLGVEDAAGYNKGLYQRGMPPKLFTYMGVEHYPENRAKNGQNFDMPYYVTVCGFNGDWWNAARIYREWWLRQQWASKEPMIFRKDVPEWLKNAVMSIKLSSSPPRSVSDNLSGALDVGRFVNNRPVLGIWYQYEDTKAPMTGWGFPLPPQPGVEAALKQMSQANIHVLAYVQSLIYDQDFNKDDLQEASKYFARDLSGKPCNYETKMSMCRSTDWWHRRILQMSDNVLKLGFEGIYLDSFGKGSPECFDPAHGHPLGGGNYGIQGQRILAEHVRQLIKKASANNTMAGEAPVEAFVDKLDYYLFAVNTMPNYVPIWRTVLGDYMIGHGRGMAKSKYNDNIPAECGMLFVDGTIFGRIFVYGKTSIFKSDIKQWDFIKLLMDYTSAGIDYLRMGEFMHPARLNPLPPEQKHHEYEKNSEIVNPMVLNSVTRSHRDGSVAYVFVNTGDSVYKGTFEADAGICRPAKEKAEISQMARDGKLQKVMDINGKTQVAIELKPLDVAFFIMR